MYSICQDLVVGSYTVLHYERKGKTRKMIIICNMLPKFQDKMTMSNRVVLHMEEIN